MFVERPRPGDFYGRVYRNGAKAAPVAEATDLVLRYGTHLALDRSTFIIPSHGITAVIGPNGSGKSTVLNAVAALLPVASGALRVLGRSAREARGEISYVLQSMVVPPTTPMTVRETVRMGRYPSSGWWRPFTSTDRERIDQRCGGCRSRTWPGATSMSSPEGSASGCTSPKGWSRSTQCCCSTSR